MKINKTLFLSTCISISIMLIRVKMTHQIAFMFLLWNLFLAAIPYVISLIAIKSKYMRKSVFLLSILLFTWLAFLPNSPYIITDLIHLKHHPETILWFDIFLISSFAINGLLFGVYSLSNIHYVLQNRMNSKIACYSIIACSFLSGYGVYLGRSLRFNTWDLLTNPTHLLSKCIDSLSNPSAWVFTLCFGWLLTVLFMFAKNRIQNTSNNIIEFY